MYSRWLKTQFDANPAKSKAELARAMGVEPPAISKILNGTRQVKAHEYSIMRRFFGLPVDGEKLAAPGRPDKSYTLHPLTGFSDFGTQDGDEAAQWIIPAAVLETKTQAQPEQIKIFDVQETVMEPDYRRGEHILVDVSATVPSPPGVFVVSDGFGFMVRQCEIIPGSNPVQIKISASNSQFTSQTLMLNDIKIIGRVIAKLQWI